MTYFMSRVRKDRKWRAGLAAAAVVPALAGGGYLYFHNPYSYPIPCLFHVLTGLYCPGCGAGRACYSLLHLRIWDAFCYNPVMTVLLPFIALYIAVRGMDWILTGGNHVDGKISVKVLVWILIGIMIYGILRNIPVFPFELLAPGGMQQII